MMNRYFDNWERLVEAVMRREQLRQLSLDNSRTTSTRSFDSDSDSDFSSSSSISRIEGLRFRPTPSPLHPDAKLEESVREGRKQSGKAKRRNIWKRFSIFSGFSLKKDYSREETESKWANAQRTLHGCEITRTEFCRYEETSQMKEEFKRRVEIARVREQHTLKGHIESLVKRKGLDIELIPHYYTI